MQYFLCGQKRWYLLVFFLGISFYTAFAQNTSDPIIQQDYQSLLDSLEETHDQVGFRSKVNGVFRRLREEWPEGQMERGYQQMLVFSNNYYGKDHRINALILHQAGIHQYLEDQLDTALVLFSESIKIRESILPATHPEMGHSFYLLGRTHYYLDNNDAAIKAFKQSFQIYESQQNCAMVVSVLRMLGDTYDYLEEQELAEAYYDLLLANARQCYDLDNPALANLYFYAARVFSDNKKKRTKALEYYQIAQQIFERGNNEETNNYVSSLMNQGAVYIDLEKYEAAFKALNQAFLLKKEREDESGLDIYYECIGAIYRRQKQYNQSLAAYQKAFDIRIAESDTVSKDINYAYHNLAEVHQESGDFQQAVDLYQKALQSADRNFTSSDYFDNPKPDNLDLTIESKELIKDLDFKGRLFYEWYNESGDIVHLKIALASYRCAIELIDGKRADLISDGSKLLWQEKLFPVFEHALKVALEIYEKEGLLEMKDLIYEWMEQSKSMVLLESLAAQQEEVGSVGQDSLLRQIELLEDQVSSLQREFIETPADDRLKKDFLKAQIDYWETKRILNEYKSSFRNQIQELDQTTLSDFQAQLNDEHSLFVEYFVGNQEVFALFFNKNQSYVFSTKLDDIPEQTKRLRGLLSTPNESLESYEAFQKLSHQLYLQLLSAGLNTFDESIDKITIIPDGILAALPFEVLLDQPSEAKTVYYGPDQLPYLINQYAINYAFSIATLIQQRSNQKQNAKHTYLGMAPEFKAQAAAAPSRQCNQGSLGPLLENKNEVEAINQLLSGKIASGVNANKSFFLKEGMDAQILHLATHACVDNQEPAKSKIFFSDDHLYAHELYQLELKAQMVVLSACETGVGEFQRGEGVMSLARGFAQSGAPSLTLSYWSVSDQSTAQLMRNYYTALAKGEPKHQALRSAKLDYLQNQEQLQRLHPYYWSAFVHFGDVEPIDLQSGYHFFWGYLLMIGAIAALLLFAGIQIRKSRS